MAADGQTVTGQVGQPGGEPAALLDQGGDAGAHGVVELEGEAAGRLLHRVEVVRQHDLVELGDQRHAGR